MNNDNFNDNFFDENNVIEEKQNNEVCKTCGCHTPTSKQEIEAAIERLEDRVWFGSLFITHRSPDGSPIKPKVTKELLNEGLRMLEKYEVETLGCCEMHWSQDVGKLEALNWVLQGGELDGITAGH
jgi:hypothetical protein